MPDFPDSSAKPLPSSPRGLNRREFLTGAGAGAALIGMTASAPLALAASTVRPPVLMHAGHQHDHSDATLRLLAAFGVKHICSALPSPRLDEHWSVAGLTALRQKVESFGLALDCLPLPLSTREITRAKHPGQLIARDPERERAIDDLCTIIRHAGAAGIPMLKYNLTFLGVVRTPASIITHEIYWDCIADFLQRVVPVAEEAKVRLALHPPDPGSPGGSAYQGVDAALGSVAGLKRFVEMHPSPCHGLTFCQGTVSEMLVRPGEEIHDVIRWFGTRGKIFTVHFRNIRGGFLKLHETFPAEGDVAMPRVLRTYREIGYTGMIMPDHVPCIEGDPDHYKAYSYCFGYLQALLQVLGEQR